MSQPIHGHHLALSSNDRQYYRFRWLLVIVCPPDFLHASAPSATSLCMLSMVASTASLVVYRPRGGLATCKIARRLICFTYLPVCVFLECSLSAAFVDVGVTPLEDVRIVRIPIVAPWSDTNGICNRTPVGGDKVHATRLVHSASLDSFFKALTPLQPIPVAECLFTITSTQRTTYSTARAKMSPQSDEAVSLAIRIEALIDSRKAIIGLQDDSLRRRLRDAGRNLSLSMEAPTDTIHRIAWAVSLRTKPSSALFA